MPSRVFRIFATFITPMIVYDPVDYHNGRVYMHSYTGQRQHVEPSGWAREAAQEIGEVMAQTFVVPLKMEIVSCVECGCSFGVSSEFVEDMQRLGGQVHCPAGHV